MQKNITFDMDETKPKQLFSPNYHHYRWIYAIVLKIGLVKYFFLWSRN